MKKKRPFVPVGVPGCHTRDKRAPPFVPDRRSRLGNRDNSGFPTGTNQRFCSSVLTYSAAYQVCPLCRGVASSEAEMSCPLEGRFATLERGGDAGRSRGVSTGALERGGNRLVGPRGVRMGRKLGLFESFAFFQVGRRPRAFVGPVALTCVLRCKAILVPRLGCP